MRKVLSASGRGWAPKKSGLKKAICVDEQERHAVNFWKQKQGGCIRSRDHESAILPAMLSFFSFSFSLGVSSP